MKIATLRAVSEALASHLDVPAAAIGAAQHLARDLGVDAVDLVLVLLRLDERGALSDFPLARLEEVRTVADLAALLDAHADATHERREAPTLSPPELARKESGVHELELGAPPATLRSRAR